MSAQEPCWAPLACRCPPPATRSPRPPLPCRAGPGMPPYGMLPTRGWLWLPPLLLVAGCATATHPPRAAVSQPAPESPPAAPRAPVETGRAPSPKVETERAPSPKTETGRPPSPKVEIGQASWYGHAHHGRLTASGEVFDMHDLTAAHRTLPMGSRVLVTNTTTGEAAEVRINDRGPFKDDRVLDLSYGAARLLGAVDPGLIPVKIQVIALPRRVSHGSRRRPVHGPARGLRQPGSRGSPPAGAGPRWRGGGRDGSRQPGRHLLSRARG